MPDQPRSPDGDGRRVAMVTGASRGIGAAVASRLARDGREVVLVSRSQEALDALASAIRDRGGAATAMAIDVGSSEAIQEGIQRVIDEKGRLDILVNNAGITRDNLVLRMTDDDWEDVLRIDLTAAFVATRAATRPMMRSKFGRIINISSTSGVVGNSGQANYAAAKAGLIGLTKSLARELGGKGITANVIAPGFIETDMTSNLGDEIKGRVLEGMAIRRLGTPDDIAATVSYVSSDEAGFLTGQVICVDGGLTMC